MSTRSLYLLLSCFSCAGCFPQNFVLWSPDGSKAAVVVKDVRLCNAEGKLSEPILPESCRTDNGSSGVCWYPDSRSLCLLAETSAVTWAEVSRLMTEEKKNLVQTEAPAMLKEILAYEGDWNNFQPKGVYKSDYVCLLLYLRETQADAIQSKVSKNAWTKFSNTSRSINQLWKVEVENETVKSRRVLLETLDDIKMFRLSPDGRWIAIVLNDGVLAVLPPDGGMMTVAEKTITNPDFTPDGNFLVYGHGVAKEGNVPLGFVARRRLCDESGNLLKELKPEEELAGAFFTQTARLRCLKDGRILFTCMDIHLPAAANDMSQKLSLFIIDPRYPTVIRMIPEQVQAGRTMEGLDFFELSPDQTRIAIVEEDQKVSVLTLDTGNLQVMQDKKVDAPGIMIPSWRTDDELCFVVPKGSPEGSENRAEVVLKNLKTGQMRCISKDWPDEFVEGWLWKKETPTTQPTSSSATQPGK